MLNANKLRAKFTEMCMTQNEIAGYLGINPSTLARKLSGESEFTRDEISSMRKFLKLTSEEVDGIFFAD